MTVSFKIRVSNYAQNIRTTLNHAYVNNGDKFGEAVLRKCVHEAALFGRDLHGANHVAGILYKQADALVRGDTSAPDLAGLMDSVANGSTFEGRDDEAAQVDPDQRKVALGGIKDAFSPKSWASVLPWLYGGLIGWLISLVLRGL